MKKTKKDKEAKIIERNLRLAWSSLESHLWATHNKSAEGKRFHKQCVKEYAETIYNLSKLL